MKTILSLIFVLFILLTGFFTAKYFGLILPAQTVLPRQESQSPETPSIAVGEPTGSVAWKLETVVQDLRVPWSIVFTSSERMLVTERMGRVRVISNGKLNPSPLHTFPLVQSKSEEGLMGMTVDPAYVQNQLLYFCYAVPKGNEFVDRVVSLKDLGSSLTNEKILIDDIPAATNHAGCRIKFGPDGMLYISTGEATHKEIAQDLHSLGGKILRIKSDGTIPSDNPFPNSAIWTYGHRNPQGIAWHPMTGSLIETEHGPSVFDGPAGGDEVNLIEKGNNYGWPIVSHERHKDGFIDPLLVFTPAVAPASALFYSGDIFPQWKNHFFFGLLRGEGIMEVIFDESGKKPIHYEKLPGIDVGRIRDIIAGPDGYIYFSTSNQDGRGKIREGDDKIYRILPQ